MGHSFDMLTFDFFLKPPQPVTGLFLLKLIDKNAIINQKKFLGLASLGILSFFKQLPIIIL